jgi:non-specific serine/threonine protein kinase/serine/threonine-protein kinase
MSESGRPYFAMEYVPGDSITHYCDSNRLSLRDRLELFIAVCMAIHHAHQKGIIHRDLKPSNILVTVSDGSAVPKIIDFGVAKALHSRLTEQTLFTEQGRIIGTPAYMSPEQADGTGAHVDTTTDIYSLGVVLYELLVGVTPFETRSLLENGWEALCRTIRTVDPPKPSMRLGALGERAAGIAVRRHSEVPALARQVRGELDWITLRALEKDRTRRYLAASEFASDVRRFLNNQPVQAGPPTVTYRARKFVTAHKIGTLVAASIVVLLMTTTIVTAIQNNRILQERDRANSEAETATQVSNFLVELFNVSDPSEARGTTVTAREILDRGSERIDNALRAQPVTRARLLQTMGRVYQGLGLYDRARPLLEQAVSTLRASGLDHSLEYAESLQALGWEFQLEGRHRESLPLQEQALAIKRERLPADDPAVGWSLYYVGLELTQLGDEEGILHIEEAQRIFESRLGPDCLGVVWCLNDRALAQHLLRNYPEAQVLFDRSLAIRERTLPENHPEVASALSNSGYVRVKNGEYEGARLLLERALKIREDVLGPEHPMIVTTLQSFAEMAWRQNDLETARRYAEQSLAIIEKHNAHHAPYVSGCLLTLGCILRDQGELEAGAQRLQAAIELQRNAEGWARNDLAESLREYALLLRRAGNPDSALVIEAQADSVEWKPHEIRLGGVGP